MKTEEIIFRSNSCRGRFPNNQQRGQPVTKLKHHGVYSDAPEYKVCFIIPCQTFFEYLKLKTFEVIFPISQHLMPAVVCYSVFFCIISTMVHCHAKQVYLLTSVRECTRCYFKNIVERLQLCNIKFTDIQIKSKIFKLRKTFYLTFAFYSGFPVPIKRKTFLNKRKGKKSTQKVVKRSSNSGLAKIIQRERVKERKLKGK